MARVTSSQRRSHLSLASERTSQKMFLELSESVPVATLRYQPQKYSWTYPSRSLLEGARPQPEKYSWSYPGFCAIAGPFGENRKMFLDLNRTGGCGQPKKCSWSYPAMA